MGKDYVVRLKCPYGDEDKWAVLRNREETLEKVLSTRWDFECAIHGVQREIPIQAREKTLSLDPKPQQIGAPKARQRRSKRLPLRVSVVVYGRSRDKRTFREQTSTLMVNADGGLVPLTSKVNLDETVLLVNKATQEEQECRVAYVGPQVKGKTNVGIAFKGSAPHFWGLDFPRSL